ncbi:MAG TPA: hypothetical protein VFI93_11975 [Rhizomicrobium sp.]|nr:hypothetical protein [Rhizomicrobium sp.]
MNKTFMRAAFAAALMMTTAGVGAVIVPTAAHAEPKVSRDVGKLLSEAQELTKTKDWQGALAKVKEAQAVENKTDDDNYVINKFLGFVSINLQDYATATTAYEAMATSPSLPDEEKKEVFRNATLLSGQAQHWPQVIYDAKELEKLNAMDDKTYAVLAQAYYFTDDFANAKVAAQKSIDMAKASGAEPQQAALQIVMSAQAKTNDQAGAEQTLEQLAVQYNSPSSWRQLADVAMGTKGIKDLDALYLYRLKYATGAMTQADDYTIMASLANQLGYPSEAKAVLERGIGSGKLSSGKAAAQMAKARQGAAIDERSLSTYAAQAKRSKSGEQDVKLAEDYYGYGRYAEAAEAAQRAISKGGLKDPSEGPMILGMAQMGQGKYAAAEQTFKTVRGTAARHKAAHVWTLYAQAKQKATAPAQSQAAPAKTPADGEKSQ